MTDIFQRLAAPFDTATISWRVGSTNKRAWEKDQSKPRRAQALPYLDARDVMRRLDEVVTPPCWQTENIPMPNGTTCCSLSINVTGDIDNPRWVTKSDGAGATGDTNKEAEREMAEKGAYSDALKRAGVLWGIGRYLYDFEAPWVPVNELWQIEKSELPKLRAALERNGQPAKSAYQAKKDGEWKEMIAALNAAIQTGCVAEFLIDPHTSKTVSQWPDKWLTAWNEKCDQARERAAA